MEGRNDVVVHLRGSRTGKWLDDGQAIWHTSTNFSCLESVEMAVPIAHDFWSQSFCGRIPVGRYSDRWKAVSFGILLNDNCWRSQAAG